MDLPQEKKRKNISNTLTRTTSSGNLALCVGAHKQKPMLFFLVFCLCGPTEIPVGIHCLLVDVRCRLSTTTLVAFVPHFLVSPLYFSIPSRVTLNHLSLLRCAHKLPHGFWEMEGLLVVSVVLLSIHSLSRVGCPFQRLIKAAGQKDPATNTYTLTKTSVTRLDSSFIPITRDLKRRRCRTSWRVRGWRTVSVLFVFVSSFER